MKSAVRIGVGTAFVLALLGFWAVQSARLAYIPQDQRLLQGLTALIGGLCAGLLAGWIGYRVAFWWYHRNRR